MGQVPSNWPQSLPYHIVISTCFTHYIAILLPDPCSHLNLYILCSRCCIRHFHMTIYIDLLLRILTLTCVSKVIPGRWLSWWKGSAPSHFVEAPASSIFFLIVLWDTGCDSCLSGLLCSICPFLSLSSLHIFSGGCDLSHHVEQVESLLLMPFCHAALSHLVGTQPWITPSLFPLFFPLGCGPSQEALWSFM